MRIAAVTLCLLALAFGAAQIAGGAATVAIRSARSTHVGTLCGSPPVGPLTYHWPVKPFDRQHPIRGNFGDPRTLGLERLGTDRPGSPGSFTFHNGVDIVAAPDAPVYPVVSGVAYPKSLDEVSVVTSDGRIFQYIHLTPVVRTGEPVVADRTVLGFVKPRRRHVHLTEIDGFRVHNPLDPGHLEPYRDRTIPHVDRIGFATPAGARLRRTALHGRVVVTAEARDFPSLPVPGTWFDFPVAPALITWRLAGAGGPILRRTAVDFRRVEPPNRDFWHVYAAGTYQNFPDFTNHYYFREPGRYIFDLTPAPLDTRRLPNGLYRLTVSAADTCGNRSSLTRAVRIANRPFPRSVPEAALVARKRPRRHLAG